ncbi:MAG TPA: hypothetical protein VK989_08425 [Polyangia bacterium]|nr:hypothetical protein [Polyangia bacterium]
MPAAQVACGDPAATHCCSVAISADVARVSGAGGIGIVVLCIRTIASWAFVRVGSVFDVAISAA